MIASSELQATRVRNAELSDGSSNSFIYAAVVKALTLHDAHGAALDFGAGRGTLTRELGSLGLFTELHAADIVDYGAPKNDGIYWHQVDLNGTLNFPDANFDTIIASEVIEHLENPRSVAREWARLLRLGGLVVLSTPNNESWRAIMSLIKRGHFVGFLDSSYPAHITALTRTDLTRVLTEAGFRVLGVSFTNCGGIPKRPDITWQTVSFGFLRGLRWSDNLVMAAVKCK